MKNNNEDGILRLERKIISAFVKSREAWAAAAPHLEANDLSPEGGKLLDLIKEYYESDPAAGSCDVDILAARVERAIQSPKIAALVVGVLRGLPEVSEANVSREVLALKTHKTGLLLASLLAAGKRNREVDELIAQYTDLSTRTELESEEEEAISSLPIGDLVSKHFDKSNLIQIWPESLNRQIDGGAKPGHHVLVFAPTEMGKTLFALNAVAGFLKQGFRTLYIGNEDPAADILMRLISRLTGLNKYEIQSNPAKAQTIVDGRNYGLFTIAPLAPGTFPRIRRLVEKYSPKVVVLDQLRNIDVSSENRTQALEKAATEARNLAKRYNALVVSIAQAADSASGKRVLNRGDVDSSNVGIPGQIDLMLGLGADAEMEAKGIRVISLVKNKLSGNHEPITVTIDPQLSKVID